MAHFIYSAFCDESGESTVGGQIAACKKKRNYTYGASRLRKKP